MTTRTVRRAGGAELVGQHDARLHPLAQRGLDHRRLGDVPLRGCSMVDPRHREQAGVALPRAGLDLVPRSAPDEPRIRVDEGERCVVATAYAAVPSSRAHASTRSPPSRGTARRVASGSACRRRLSKSPISHARLDRGELALELLQLGAELAGAFGRGLGGMVEAPHLTERVGDLTGQGDGAHAVEEFLDVAGGRQPGQGIHPRRQCADGEPLTSPATGVGTASVTAAIQARVSAELVAPGRCGCPRGPSGGGVPRTRPASAARAPLASAPGGTAAAPAAAGALPTRRGRAGRAAP